MFFLAATFSLDEKEILFTERFPVILKITILNSNQLHVHTVVLLGK